MSSPIVEQEFEIGLSDTAKATMSAAITAAVKANLITPYSTSATYAVGDFVYYSGDGKIYKCVTAITTAEAWTSAHWSEATLNDVIDAVNAAVASVASKANVDGNYPTMTVGKSETAKNVEPYSDDSGAEQSNPVISQGTGTDNNTAIVTTGNYAQLREKQGNTLAIAQLFQNVIQGAESYGITITRIDSETVTLSGTATARFSRELNSTKISVIAGHTYFIKGMEKNEQNVRLIFNAYNGSSYVTTYANTDKGNGAVVVNSEQSVNKMDIEVVVDSGVALSKTYTIKPKLVDITSWSADVIADLTAHPDHFFWYYNGSLAHNAGSLENANGVKLVCTHRNLFAGNSESNPQYIGHYYVNPDGSKSADNNYNAFRVLVIPNKPLHLYRNGSQLATAAIWRFVDKDFNFVGVNASAYSSTYGIYTPPANAQYVEFSLSENVVFDVSLYYTTAEGGEGYDQHYEYKEPTVIDTGSEVLRSAGSAHDVKLPDGTIERRVGSYTFTGSETTWSIESGYAYTNGVILPGDKPSIPQSRNCICDIPNTDSIGITSSSTGRGIVLLLDTSVYDTSAKINELIAGHHIYYELATPTTEEGTAFPENVEIDDYGMMYWLDGSNNLVGIPQGAKFFYPFNYAGSLDDLYHYVGGDMQKIIRTYSTDAEELAENPDINKNWDTTPTQNSVKPVTSGGIFEADMQLKAALGGTLRQMLAATQSVDFANTDFVDLGDLNWSYSDGAQCFYATVSGIYYRITGTSNVISTKYATSNAVSSFSNVLPNCVAQVGGDIGIKDSAYTDATAFKAAMKGVLLAYEKASE